MGGILYVILIAIGLIMVGLVTGAIIAVIIDFLLKEGQGLGASGFRDHIVICGWNPTAREAIDELRSDTYQTQARADSRRRAQPGREARLLRPWRPIERR